MKSKSGCESASVDKAMDGFWPSISSLNYSDNVSRTHAQVSDTTGTLVKTKYIGVRQRRSGLWSSEIRSGGSKHYLGSFKTAEEAADAFARARKVRDSMKRKQKLDHEEDPKSRTKSCFGNTSADKAMDGFRHSNSSYNCSNHDSMVDTPVSNSMDSMVMKKKYMGALQASSGTSVDKAMDGFWPSISSLDYSENVSRTHAQVSDTTGTLVKTKYIGVRQRKSGLWSAEIASGGSKRYLGSFKTAEEAADAFARARKVRDSMNRKRKLDREEDQKSPTKSCFESTSADKAMDGFRPSNSSFNCSNTESLADNPVSNSMDSMVMKKKYVGALQTSPGASVDKAREGFWPSISSLKYSDNVSRTHPKVSDTTGTLVKTKYIGVRQRRSGLWSAEIRSGGSKRYLGSFKTAEEAADAFARARKVRDSMNRKQKLDHEEDPKSPTKSSFASTSADKAMDRFRPSNSSFNCSNYESGADTLVSNSMDSMVMKKKYMGALQASSGASVDKAMDGFWPSISSLDYSDNVSRTHTQVSDTTGTLVKTKYIGVRQRKSGLWSAEIASGGSKRYLGSFKTAEEAADAFARARELRDSMKRKQKLDHKEDPKSPTKSCFESTSADKAMKGFRPSNSFFNCSNYESMADTPVSNSMDSMVMKKKYMGSLQTSSGCWSAGIRLGRYPAHHLGTLETAEEADDAYTRIRMLRDLKNRNREVVFEEACKSLKKCKAMMSKPCFASISGVSLGTDEDHQEAEKVCSMKEGKFGPLGSTKRELEREEVCEFGKKSSEAEYPYLIYKAETFDTSVAVDGQQSQPSYRSNTVHAGNQEIPDLSQANADEEDLGMGIVNSCGQLIGEYSRLDDQLWFSRGEEDDDDPYNVYGS